MTDTVTPAADTSVPADTYVVDPDAESLIKNHVMAAATAAVVPLPLFDIAAITLVQVRMIAKLAGMYGKAYSEGPVRNTISALVGGAVGQGGGQLIGLSLTKFIPGIGWMLGMMSLPIVAGASTYAIGRVYARHFKQGGTVGSIIVSDVTGIYHQELERGKKVATDLQSDLKPKPAAA
jgi:uncharacterized protein (DUF697 family)